MACKLLGNWVNYVKQILGRGSYLQVSSTSYMVKIYSGFGEINDWYDCSSKSYEISQIKKRCYFYILKKGDCLPQEDVTKRFIFETRDGYGPSLGKRFHSITFFCKIDLCLCIYFKKSSC